MKTESYYSFSLHSKKDQTPEEEKLLVGLGAYGTDNLRDAIYTSELKNPSKVISAVDRATSTIMRALKDGGIFTANGQVILEGVQEIPSPLIERVQLASVLRRKWSVLKKLNIGPDLSGNTTAYIVDKDLERRLYRVFRNNHRGLFYLEGIDESAQFNFWRLIGQRQFGQASPFMNVVKKSFKKEDIPLTVGALTVIEATLQDITVTWGLGVKDSRLST